MVREFRESNVFHHTYQLKEERAYRIAIKCLHHSTSTEDIKEELSKLGHRVTNIVNVQHRITIESLNLFFIDLEPSETNKDVYNKRALNNKSHHRTPRLNRNNIVQCKRCQQYGHSKNFCNKPYACVKRGGSHRTSVCKKSKETPARCALCAKAIAEAEKICNDQQLQ
nr:unnamed protein product [Callosobruchus analis]